MNAQQNQRVHATLAVLVKSRWLFAFAALVLVILVEALAGTLVSLYQGLFGPSEALGVMAAAAVIGWAIVGAILLAAWIIYIPVNLIMERTKGLVARREEKLATFSENSLAAHLSEATDEEVLDLADDEFLDSYAPARTLVRMCLLMGIRDKATDVHFGPLEDYFKITYAYEEAQYRGRRYEIVPPPRHLAGPTVIVIKGMAGLEIAKTRVSQNGTLRIKVEEEIHSLGVNIEPTPFGEKAVIEGLNRIPSPEIARDVLEEYLGRKPILSAEQIAALDDDCTYRKELSLFYDRVTHQTPAS